jgi:hypothetical protein
MSSLVDTIRYDILESKMNEARLAQYWMAMQPIGSTIFLSSAPEANPWLSDIPLLAQIHVGQCLDPIRTQPQQVGHVRHPVELDRRSRYFGMLH